MKGKQLQPVEQPPQPNWGIDTGKAARQPRSHSLPPNAG